jgi:8-oxo-dGTP diphosphatase
MSDDGVIFIAATQCAVIRGDRFLVIVRADGIKDAPGALVFPGGKVEVEDGPGDVLETAVRREVLEETGISVSSDLEYVRSLFYELDDGSPVVDTLFLGRYGDGEPHIADTNEVAEVEWMTAEEILAHDKTPQWNKPDVLRVEALRVHADHAG